MCLPPDVIPSLNYLRKTRGPNANQWAVDQRPFVWAAAKSSEEAQGPLWTSSWTDSFYPGTLPFSGSAKAGVSDEQPEAGPRLTLGCSLGPLGTAPVPEDHEVLQPKVWEPRPNGRTEVPIVRSFLCSPPSYAASRVDAAPRQQSLSREGSIVSCTSSPRIPIPVINESSHSSKFRDPVDSWEGSKSTEDRSRRTSWVEELIHEDRMQNADAVKRKLSISSTCTGKSSRIISHKPRQCNRPSAPKKEIATRSKDVSMSESLSDNEDISDDEGEGPGVSEKRRKRMLSNRASAQRSRQRRQERLDTLEVLVAELRVENASLSRRASNAATAAKKFEEENKALRDRLGKQEYIPLSDSNGSNDSDKTTENSEIGDDEGKGGSLWRAAVRAAEPGRNVSKEENWGIKRSNYNQEIRQESCRPSKCEYDDKLEENAKQAQQRQLDNSVAKSNFAYDPSSGHAQNAAPTCRGTTSRTTHPGMLNQMPQAPGGMGHKVPSFQGLDAYGIDLEQCSQDMDRKNLDSRTVEEIWLESLANCLK